MSSQRTSLVRSARREAIICGIVFVVALIYTVVVSTRMGYVEPGAEAPPLKFVLGFPDWVFYGILAPWAVCTVIAGIFSFVLMRDHDLGESADESGIAPIDAGEARND